ncbi:MAG TPA: hypothetical protein VK003_10405 [Oceanobacillus sp.]|jgi:hypothetical protein|nr:hypothetical protein [Oceanobacillus sp.]
MREVSFSRFSSHGRGMFVPPFVPLLLGLFVLFLVIKSGLWLPLLALGLVFWMFSPMRRRWHGGFMDRHWRVRHYYSEPTPRKNDDIEYV